MSSYFEKYVLAVLHVVCSRSIGHAECAKGKSVSDDAFFSHPAKGEPGLASPDMLLCARFFEHRILQQLKPKKTYPN